MGMVPGREGAHRTSVCSSRRTFALAIPSADDTFPSTLPHPFMSLPDCYFLRGTVLTILHEMPARTPRQLTLLSFSKP